MVSKSSKRKLDVIIIFLIIFAFILNGYLSAQAKEALILHQSEFQIESISCKGLSIIKKLLTNLDHNSRMRVVDYPNTFEVTHHSSIHEDTIVSVLSNAGYPTKKLNIQKRMTSPFQKVKTKGNVVNQIPFPAEHAMQHLLLGKNSLGDSIMNGLQNLAHDLPKYAIR